jgi:hypothetical protein
MRYLAPLGLRVPFAGPPSDSPRVDLRPSWIHWHLRAILRERGLPAARFDEPYLKGCRDMLADGWVGPQQRYHADRKDRTEAVKKACEALSYVFFGLAVVGCVLHLLHLDVGPEFLPLLLAAGAPAWGAAFHGILSQGEYERLHEQHEAMAQRLSKTRSDLRAWVPHGQGSSRNLRRLALGASLEMITDVSSWQELYRAHAMPLV